MGIRAHDTAEISLSDVWVPRRIWLEERESSTASWNSLTVRAYVAAQGWGRTGRLEMALEYVRKSDQSGRSLSFFEIVQSKLARWQR
jgi:alkylation response protein AidB-like acyl-CoA dehydrogenase